MKSARVIITFVLIGLVACLSPVFEKDASAETVAAGTASIGAPTMYNPAWSSEPPVLTEQQKAQMDWCTENSNRPGPRTPQSSALIAGPVPGTETGPGLTQVPGDLVIRRNADLSSIVPAGYASTILEPSVVNEGMSVFYTANWFAARSATAAGATGTWSYINTYADFANFCCDQDTVYDPARRALLWYRQGVSDVNGNNIFKLGVSTDGGATFCNYDYAPSNLGLTNQWWDYPHLALSNNFLYIATNVFNASGVWTETVVLRWPLDSLATCSGFSFSYHGITDRFNVTPVQGATTIMYYATHNSTSSERIYTWPEASGSISTTDVTIPAWTSTGRGSAVCTTADSYNPCARYDDRILSGWVADWDGATASDKKTKVIGFFWNVKQDGVNFVYPYVNSAVFKESDLTYLARPFIWSSTWSFLYAVGAPNARGNLGVSLFHVPGSPAGYPTHDVLIDDDYNGAPPGWEGNFAVNVSTAGPSRNAWGDYVRVRPHSPAKLQWMATGWYITSSASNVSIPKYVIFGRERDNKSLNRWLLN